MSYENEVLQLQKIYLTNIPLFQKLKTLKIPNPKLQIQQSDDCGIFD